MRIELVQAADPRKDDGSTLLAAGTKLGVRVRKATTTARGLRPQASISRGRRVEFGIAYTVRTYMYLSKPGQMSSAAPPMATPCFCRVSGGSLQIGAPSFDLSRASEASVGLAMLSDAELDQGATSEERLPHSPVQS